MRFAGRFDVAPQVAHIIDRLQGAPLLEAPLQLPTDATPGTSAFRVGAHSPREYLPGPAPPRCLPLIARLSRTCITTPCVLPQRKGLGRFAKGAGRGARSPPPVAAAAAFSCSSSKLPRRGVLRSRSHRTPPPPPSISQLSRLRASHGSPLPTSATIESCCSTSRSHHPTPHTASISKGVWATGCLASSILLRPCLLFFHPPYGGLFYLRWKSLHMGWYFFTAWMPATSLLKCWLYWSMHLPHLDSTQ